MSELRATPPPQVVVLAGPNGAGKTTSSGALLRDLLKLGEFVNADVIAQGLAGFAPEASAFAAGRIMLRRLHELAEQRANFAFETTLASRGYLPWLRTLRQSGYEINLVYLWLESPALALRRIRQRVRDGGHHVPAVIVRRRFRRGLSNLFSDYLPLAARWRVYDNSADGKPILIASGSENQPTIVLRESTWDRMQKEARRVSK